MKWLPVASLACACGLAATVVQAQEGIPPGSSSVNEINEAIAAAGKRNLAQAAPRLQGFSVALLLGAAQGSTAPDGLSAPARKALADISDFLPYKTYRVLDTQWIAGTERGGVMQFSAARRWHPGLRVHHVRDAGRRRRSTHCDGRAAHAAD